MLFECNFKSWLCPGTCPLWIYRKASPLPEPSWLLRKGDHVVPLNLSLGNAGDGIRSFKHAEGVPCYVNKKRKKWAHKGNVTWPKVLNLFIPELKCHLLLQPCWVCTYLPFAPSRYTLSPSLSDMSSLPCSLPFYWVWQVWGRWDHLTSSLNSNLFLPMGLLYPALSTYVLAIFFSPLESRARNSFTAAKSKHPQLPVHTFVNGLSIFSP